jgi:PAS domain S-box-containing protein
MQEINDSKNSSVDLAQLLRSAHERFRTLVHSLPVGIAITTGDGAIEAVNPELARMFGCAEHELVGVEIDGLIAGTPWNEVDSISQWCKENANKVVEAKAYTRDNQKFQVDIRVRSFETDEQERLLIVIQDVTERFVANKLKQDLFRMISHDIRSPLSAIKLVLELLEEECSLAPLTDARKLSMSRARANLNRVLTLVSGLLELDRVKSGELQLDKRMVDLQTAIASAAAGLYEIAQEKGIGIELLPTTLAVSADPLRLEQVLVNLIGNAVSHSQSDKPITVSVSDRSTAVRIAVQDAGKGIPDDEKLTIFDSFKQGKQESGQGFGLGLAICKQIVLAHSGRIGVDDADGGGSIFWFELPKAQPDSPRSSE